MTALFKELLQGSFQLAKSPGVGKHFRDGRSHRLVTFAMNFQNASSTHRAPAPESPPTTPPPGQVEAFCFCIVQNAPMRSAGPHTAEGGLEAGRLTAPGAHGLQDPQAPAPPAPRPSRRPGRVSLAGSAPCRPLGAPERGRCPSAAALPRAPPALPRGELRGCRTPYTQGTPVCSSHSRGQAKTVLSIELHTSITSSPVHHELVNTKKKKKAKPT